MPEQNPLSKIRLLAEAALAKGSPDAMECALEVIVALTRYPIDVISWKDSRLAELGIVRAEWEDNKSVK